MTIETQVTEVTFTGNSSAYDFDFEFPVFQKSDMEVTVTTVATGAEETLDAADFDIVFNDDWSGTVTYPLSGSALTSDYEITLHRVVEYTQEAEISNQRKFYPRVIERQLDKIVMQTIQLSDEDENIRGEHSRFLRVPRGETLEELQDGSLRGNGFLYVNSTGGTDIISLPDLGDGETLDLTVVDNRVMLASLLPSIKLAYLDEDLRFGLFKYDSGDWSDEVADDPEEGVYVAVASDATGASGAWIRQSSVLTPEMFGAANDCDNVAKTGTDDVDALEAFFRWCYKYPYRGELSGAYLCGRKITADVYIAGVVAGVQASIFWPVANTTFGLELHTVDNSLLKGVKLSGIIFYTGSSADISTQHVGLLYDNTENIVDNANKDKTTYAVVGGGAAEFRDLRFEGINGPGQNGWFDGFRMLCASNANLYNVAGAGRRLGDETVKSRWLVHSASRDYDSRTITNITVAAGVATVTWNTATGNYFGYPNADSANGYIYITGLAGALGFELNDRNFKINNVNNVAGTFDLRDFDATMLPAYTSGGTWEGAPQTTGINVNDSGGTWYGVYMAQGEGQTINNCQFTGAYIGYMVEEQLGFRVFGTTHAAYKRRGIYARGIGKVSLQGISFIKHAQGPYLTVTGVTIANPGVFTYSNTAPAGIVDGCRLVFDVSAGMVELDGESYVMSDHNTGAKTFKLKHINTGNYLNTTTFTAWTAGNCELVGIAIELENCNGFNISGGKFGVAGQGANDPIILRDCTGGGYVSNNLFDGLGAYAAIRLEGDTTDVTLEGFKFETNKFSQIVEDNTGGDDQIYYTNRPHDVAITMSSDTFLSSNRFGNDVATGHEHIRVNLTGESHVVTGINGGYYNRRMIVFNDTLPEQKSAAVFTLASDDDGSTDSRRLMLDNKMPVFLLPGYSFPLIYSKDEVWVPQDSWDWKKVFDVFSDMITANAFETVQGGSGTSIAASNFGGAGSVRRALGVQKLECTTNGGGISHGLFTAQTNLQTGCSFFMARVGTATLSTSGEEYTARVGFLDSSGNTANPTDGAWMEYKRLTGTDWQMRTANSGSGTTTATGKTVLVNRFDYVTVFVSSDQVSDSKVAFGWGRSGDDFETLGTIENNWGNTWLTNFGVQLLKTAGNSAVDFQIDMMGVAINKMRT